MASMSNTYDVVVNTQPVQERCHDDYHSFSLMPHLMMLWCERCGMTLSIQTREV